MYNSDDLAYHDFLRTGRMTLDAARTVRGQAMVTMTRDEKMRKLAMAANWIAQAQQSVLVDDAESIANHLRWARQEIVRVEAEILVRANETVRDGLGLPEANDKCLPAAHSGAEGDLGSEGGR